MTIPLLLLLADGAAPPEDSVKALDLAEGSVSVVVSVAVGPGTLGE